MNADAGGLIVFSNNFRRFRLDAEVEEQFFVQDVSSASIPFDFTRNSRIHHCYELQARSGA